MDENKLAEEKRFLESINFTQQARYRCEQVSLSKIDSNITANGKQKFQYFLNLSADKRYGKVHLEEHHYDFSPAVINKSFELISKNELLKHNVIFSIDEFGKFEKILNKLHLERDWTFFREGEFQNVEFVEHVRHNDPAVYDELIKSGNLQFSESYDLGFEFRANLYYLILLDDHLTNIELNFFPNQKLKFTSILFPNLFIPLEITTDIAEYTPDSISISRRGTVIMDEDLSNQIIESYKVLYQPSVGFEFSEYRLKFEVNLKFDKATRLAEFGTCVIEEEVLNNVENVCSFSLKRVKT